MRSRFFAGLALVALTFSISAIAHADDKAFTYEPGADFTNGQWSLGWQFSVNSDVSVTQLGYYDDFDNGLAESHDVGIFDSMGNLLVSATVVPGDTLDNHFRYTSISPVTLTTGNIYFIAGETGSENYGFGGAVTTAPEVNFLQDAFVSSPVLAFPDSTDFGTNAYFGPNFKFAAVSAVPEPGVVPFAILAGGSLLGLIARKRKA